MSSLTHCLATLWARFRWEILGFLLLVIASAIVDLAAPLASGVLAALKTLLLFWLTLRIALSETGFKTHGGWQTRPFNPRSVLLAQLLLLLALAAMMLLVRAFVMQQIFHPSAGQWLDMLRGSFATEILPWLTFLLCLKGFAFLLLRPLEGRARQAAWATMVIVLVPCLLGITYASSGLRRSSQGGSSHSPEELSQSIQAQLPDATDFVGMWRESIPSSEVPSARLLARIPLDSRQVIGAPGLHLESLGSFTSRNRKHLRFEFLSLDPLLLDSIADAFPVLAYRGGYYGSPRNYMIERTPGRGLITRPPAMSYRLSFISPLCLPEFQHADPERFAATEVLFFVPSDPSLPTSLNIPGRTEVPLRPPLAIPLPDNSEASAASVRQLIDSLVERNSPPSDDLIHALVSSLPAEAMAPILAYRPWPERAWEKVVLPFLTKHADDSHKSALLERLALDPRLATLFIEKGWEADAIPVLRQRAAERLPLPAADIALLAEQNDPALSEDLAALAIRLNRGIDSLAPVLRASDGFDWPAFVSAGWKSRKYGGYQREGWLYAFWAAQLGDASALRRLAEEAASGKAWEREQLGLLIPSAPEDLIPFLRENLTNLQFQSASRTWAKP